ncbi:MAG: TrkA family potassium uptake protein [Methanosarcinaceae archaeon]|nr:TrkA family potassium uptake protein [Methanosarcinaceae archaeon]MDD4331897.1 TrkA family potassium uptake protein [Methanosarcinaceae archaeon]MDD4749250.1 TrkA family potassium uptake protein [Methanosarcinaceae archaeon]
MRIIIIGASPLGLHLTRSLILQGNELVLIEREEGLAKELAEELDCSVIHAEGTRPDILEKAGIEEASALVACTEHDQDNILIGLIAREAAVEKIIIKTDDEKFTAVARKLGFHHLINPPHLASMVIADALRGVNTIELSNLMRSDVRFTSVLVGAALAGKKVSELLLPEKTEIIGFYRKNDFILTYREKEKSGGKGDFRLEAGDELLIITRTEQVKKVYEMLKEVEETSFSET